MKWLLVLFLFASCMVPSRIVERYETDSITGKTTKYVTKYYDSVRYVREPCPYPVNVFPFYDPFYYRPIFGPRVIVRHHRPAPAPQRPPAHRPQRR